MTNRAQLPPGWKRMLFNEVVTIDSNLVDPADHPDEPHIAPNHIESKTGRLLPYQTIAQDKVTSPKHRFHSGQVLYSKIRPYLAKAVLVNFGGLCSADMYPLSTILEPGYLYRWLLTDEFTARVSMDQGRTILPKVNQASLGRIEIAVPPLGEQRRIVAKLEALLARSRRAKEALDAIPALLERFRQSVLAAAIRGDLTADWREKNRDVEPASKLLEQIRAERRRRLEQAELEKMKARGKAPKADAWKAKYEEPEPIDDSEMPKLPRGWSWASLDLLLVSLRNGISARPDEEDGLPILRISAVRPMHVDLEDVRFLPDVSDHEPYCLAEQDLLFTRYNGNAELVGSCAVVPHVSRRIVYPDKLIRGRVVDGLVCPDYIAMAASTGVSREFIASKSKSAAGQIGISGSDLRRVPIPLAPLAEQHALVAQVQALFTSCSHLAEVAQAAAQRQEQLNQSILAKAFRGELVPQDPNDEPASALLERIRAERSGKAMEPEEPTPSKADQGIARRTRRKNSAQGTLDL